MILTSSTITSFAEPAPPVKVKANLSMELVYSAGIVNSPEVEVTQVDEVAVTDWRSVFCRKTWTMIVPAVVTRLCFQDTRYLPPAHSDTACWRCTGKLLLVPEERARMAYAPSAALPDPSKTRSMRSGEFARGVHVVVRAASKLPFWTTSVAQVGAADAVTVTVDAGIVVVVTSVSAGSVVVTTEVCVSPGRVVGSVTVVVSASPGTVTVVISAGRVVVTKEVCISAGSVVGSVTVIISASPGTVTVVVSASPGRVTVVTSTGSVVVTTEVCVSAGSVVGSVTVMTSPSPGTVRVVVSASPAIVTVVVSNSPGRLRVLVVWLTTVVGSVTVMTSPSPRIVMVVVITSERVTYSVTVLTGLFAVSEETTAELRVIGPEGGAPPPLQVPKFF